MKNTIYSFIVDTEQNHTYDITQKIISFISKSGILDGLCLVQPISSTCSIYTAENRVGLQEDIRSEMAKIIPSRNNFAASKESPVHISSTIKAILGGKSKVLILHDGTLVLPPMEKLFLTELEIAKETKVVAKIIEC